MRLLFKSYHKVLFLLLVVMFRAGATIHLRDLSSADIIIWLRTSHTLDDTYYYLQFNYTFRYPASCYYQSYS
uniref:Putative secreted protein n=1 Tax=Anopheles triannulatus TaxID=58253 RepID=A0A2M4B7M8_9DIPT